MDLMDKTDFAIINSVWFFISFIMENRILSDFF